MEKSIIVAVTAAVTLAFTSQFSTAGSITDTYTAGDTLTTTTLDNIKSAVNDNNTASRFYGDGSAGSLTVSAFVSWGGTTPPTGSNLNFTDLTIDAGSTLTVPGGTTIRCTGTFTNNGTIRVSVLSNRGIYGSSPISFAGFTAPGRGDAYGVAGMPEGHTALGVFLLGGNGGTGIQRTVAASSFNNFTMGGGGGSGRFARSGGGLVKIYCQGAIINNGVIEANGDGSFGSVGGGGGGGIVILASSTSVDNSVGTIGANGGVGGSSDTLAPGASGSVGASGGGGGGIIFMVAPTIANLGTTFVTGGAAGTGGTTLTSSLHYAGGGGGASGGNGGSGGDIGADNIAGVAEKGFDGYVLEITANPAHMM